MEMSESCADDCLVYRHVKTPGGSKKFKVCAKNTSDSKYKEKLVRFGDNNMKIKAGSKDNRSSFRSRHGCDKKKDKTTAGYWSCRAWPANGNTPDWV